MKLDEKPITSAEVAEMLQALSALGRAFAELRAETPSELMADDEYPDVRIARAAALIERLASAVPPAPDGWRMVPVQPTREMTAAGEDSLLSTLGGAVETHWHADDLADQVYRAMLSAAPVRDPLPRQEPQR